MNTRLAVIYSKLPVVKAICERLTTEVPKILLSIATKEPDKLVALYRRHNNLLTEALHCRDSISHANEYINETPTIAASIFLAQIEERYKNLLIINAEFEEFIKQEGP